MRPPGPFQEYPLGGRRALLAAFCRWCIGTVFLLAAVGKLLDFPLFLNQIREYRLLPDPVVLPAALCIIGTEGVAALLLVAGILPRGSALLLACLTALFTVAIGIVTLRGTEMDCSCFGRIARMPVGPWSLGRNLAFIAGLLCVAGHRQKREPARTKRGQPGESKART
jgi:uncharacterized membrane protein YphA (DoxX/SURF4 family)